MDSPSYTLKKLTFSLCCKLRVSCNHLFLQMFINRNWRNCNVIWALETFPFCFLHAFEFKKKMLLLFLLSKYWRKTLYVRRYKQLLTPAKFVVFVSFHFKAIKRKLWKVVRILYVTTTVKYLNLPQLIYFVHKICPS